MTYTSVFTGSVINPADVSYLPVTLTADITLEWPLESNAPTYPAAGVVDVTSIVGAYAITLPNATQGSTGAAILFNGLSTNTQSVTIKNNAGTTVATLASGTQWLLVLAGISTAAGVWRAFQLGATTSAATAASLAGYGIVASSGLLSQAAAVTTFSASPRTVLTTDRASLMVWTGTGSATFNLPTAATAGNNFFVMARNSGGGDMTIDPNGSETINGSTTVALHPGDSAFLVTDGLKWYSVGLGRDAAFAFDFTSISLASAAATYTLSGAELNRVAYKFTGLLTNDVAVVVPATVQQYWVENATTGSFAVTLKTSGGTPVSVTQGGRDIYYCNGTNVVRATTGGIAVPIGVTDGGTGLSSFAVGDIIYASGATTLGKLTDVATGNALLSGGVGVAPAYGKVGLTTHVSGTLPVANGGTGITALGTGVATALGINVGSAGAPVVLNGALGTPASGVATNLTGLPLTTGVTGTLPVANGGTGVTTSTGTGSAVLSNGPTFVAPLLGTPASGVATNLTGLPLTTGVTGTLPVANGGTGITAFGTGIATALGVNVGSAGAPVLLNGALGTPSSGTATNLTGLPLTTGVTGTLPVANGGTGVTSSTGTGSTVLSASPTFTGVPAAPTAAPATNTTQLATCAFVTAAVTASGGMVYPGAGVPNSTGSAWGTSYTTSGTGTVLALTNGPTFVAPLLGTPASGVATNLTGLPLTTGVTGTLPVANGGTGITSLGTGVATALGINVGSAGAPIVLNGALGTPSSGTATNLMGLPLTSGVTGTLPVGNGGTGVTTSTGTGNVVLSASPTFTGVPVAPTAAGGTNTTQIATCAFVIANAGAMTYPGAGIAVSTGSAWGTSLSSTAPTFTTSLTSPICYGGTTASSSLTVQSTSGTGTSDKIIFKTGNGAQAGQIDTYGSWSFGANAGGQYITMYVGNDLTGSTAAMGVYLVGTVKSDVTSSVNMFRSEPTTQAAAFTLTTLSHFQAINVSKGAASAVTNQYGFHTGALSGGANNYGVYSNVAAAATNWNFYAAGNAGSYMAGDLRIGTTSQSGSNALTVSGGIVSVSGAIGYAVGAGGAVTQATSRTTGVTLNTPTGAITLVSAAGTATWQTFTVTNSAVAATDTINVCQKSGTDKYMIFVTAVGAGSFAISFATTGGTTTEQPVFNFAVVKAAAS